MTLSRPRAVLFDLDGTLINTAPEFIHIAAELRREAALPVMDTQTVWRSVSDGAIGMVQAALEISVSDPSFEFWRQRFLDHYESGLGSLSEPYPGMRELVSSLGSHGVPWGIVTNKLARFAVPLMTLMSFTPSAEVVLTPDDVIRPKPDPESLLLACEKLQCSASDTIFIGDHRRDIDAGIAAGCQTIAASYGYLADGESAQDWGADAIATSSLALRILIEDLLA